MRGVPCARGSLAVCVYEGLPCVSGVCARGSLSLRVWCEGSLCVPGVRVRGSLPGGVRGAPGARAVCRRGADRVSPLPAGLCVFSSCYASAPRARLTTRGCASPSLPCPPSFPGGGCLVVHTDRHRRSPELGGGGRAPPLCPPRARGSAQTPQPGLRAA